ncbi:MAG: peptidoglycan DD-metalloendopeptidase family protein [Pseudomonadales bacterium]
MVVLLTMILVLGAISSLNVNIVNDHLSESTAAADFGHDDKYPSTLSRTNEALGLAEIDSISNNRIESSLTTATVIVEPRDNLAMIFQREGISAKELQSVLESDELAQHLMHIYPGQKLNFERRDDGTLMRLVYSPKALESLVFVRRGTSFEVSEIVRQPEIQIEILHGLIDDSLFVASQRIGLDDETTMRLAQIFQWDIDFVLDIRKGDEFDIVVEKLHLNGDFVGYGNILAARFVNQRNSYLAVQYADTSGTVGYFSPRGESIKKAFLRAPLEFTRISSNFNMKRLHPLWNRAMPHRGIDYVAPVGTRVLAAGSGRVRAAGYTKANGNYVVIGHGAEFETKYLHLSKFGTGIRRGKKLNQGDTVGYVGSTGWATGPHLHYEFLVNGKHKNPRTVALPKSDPIRKPELKRFRSHVQSTIALLTNGERAQLRTAATD